MFIGQYNNKMDAKGRLSIPIKFRDDLGEKFIITRRFRFLFIWLFFTRVAKSGK